MSELIVNAGTYRGYDVFLDSDGFYVNGKNGLNEPKKIHRKTLKEIQTFIDEQMNYWLGR